jgi:RNA polymerase sigma factor (TIGR02999 family)
MDDSPGEITQLLVQLRDGDPEAEARLINLVYDELRRLAKLRMRYQRPDHTLQPTALVHEAYIRLTAQRDVKWEDRAHFFGVAAHIMRQIVMEYARAQRAEKRGAHVRKLSLDESIDFSHERSREFVALDDALMELAELDPRQGRIVELRFFGGLSVEEIAEVMGISTRTVKREWRVARAWLRGELSKASAVV